MILVVSGAALLFTPDAALPRFIPDFPVAGLRLGQLLGAAWLGLAALNWLNPSNGVRLQLWGQRGSDSIYGALLFCGPAQWGQTPLGR